MKTLLVLFLVTFAECIYGQETYFEGKITYRVTSTDDKGKPQRYPIETVEDYHTKSQILTKFVAGETLKMAGKIGVILDSESKSRYAIDYGNNTARELGAEKNGQTINAMEFRKTGDTLILGYACSVFLIKYVHTSNYAQSNGFGPPPDTVTFTYYISSALKVFRPDVFAKLQGSQNSLLLDGRFQGIPLKLVTYSFKTYLTMEAVKVEEMQLGDLLAPFTIKR